MKKIFFFLLILYFAYSCAPVYTPNIVNTPLLSSKGELQALIGTGTSGVDPQLAYAITNHFGVMVNASFANRNDSLHYHKHNYCETGLGYTLQIQNAACFEVFAGGGYGTVDALYNRDGYYGKSKGDLVKIFLQPTIGAKSKIFEGSFTQRLVFIKINNSEKSLNTNRLYSFIEPTITVKLGWKYVKMFFQVGFSVPLNTYSITNQPFIFNVGWIGKIPIIRQ
jgi:hypothetical protein